MSTTAAAAKIAESFTALGEFDLDELHSDQGLLVEGVAVWHRESDDMIVAFVGDGDDAEDWAETPVVR